MVKILLDGNVVSRSKDLGGIIRYARKHGVVAYGAARKSDGSGSLLVRFANNAVVFTNFESFLVLRDWLKARRSWSQQVDIDGEQLFTAKRNF